MLSKIVFLNVCFDIPFILACNSISLIPFNRLQSQLSIDVLSFRMDQVDMKLTTKT